jgi:hypothetical protein
MFIKKKLRAIIDNFCRLKAIIENDVKVKGNTMNSYTKLPAKPLYRMLTACAVIVVALSVQTMIQVKDIELYRLWANSIGSPDATFSTYVTVQLMQFFGKIIVPVIFAVYAYFAHMHIRVNSLFVFIWSVLLAGSFLFTLVEWDLGSVFYYLSLAGHAVLIYTVLSLGQTVKDSKHR